MLLSFALLVMLLHAQMQCTPAFPSLHELRATLVLHSRMIALNAAWLTLCLLLIEAAMCFADAVAQCSTGSSSICSAEMASLITDPDSVVWYRGYVHQYERDLCPLVQQVLEAMQVQRIVAGHNVMSDGRVKSLCGGKVNLIDVGISRAYLGNMAVWTCSNNAATAIHPPGRSFRLRLSAPIQQTS